MYLKPKYNHLGNSYIPNKPFYYTDTRFENLKEIYAPLAVSIWRDWQHNFTAESEITKEVWIINDTFKERKKLSILYGFKEFNKWQEIKLPLIKSGQNRSIGKLKFKLPATEKRKELTLQVKLLEEGRLVNKDRMKITIYPKNKSEFNKDKTISLYDNIGNTTQALTAAKINFTKYKIKESDLKNTDLLIIGANSMDFEIEEDLERIQNYLKNGGKMLVFEQPSVTAVSRSIAFVNAPDHPVFAGINKNKFYLWNGTSGEIIKGVSLLPRKRPYCSLVNIGGKGHLGINSLTSSDIYSALYEEHVGSGLVMTCHLEVSKRFGIDPEASRLFINMISYMSNKKPQPNNEVITIRSESSNVLLNSIQAKNVNSDTKLLDIPKDPKGIYLLGPGTLSKQIKLLNENKSKIESFVAKGGTVLCLEQSPDTWDSSWLPKTIQLKRNSKYIRGATETNPLTDGIRRAFIDFKKHNKIPVFSNHFKIPQESGWKALITSRLPEFSGMPERAEYTIIAGSPLIKLSHGKGCYILCQLPIEKESGMWIKESIVQLMTNLGIKPKQKASENEIIASSTKVKPALDKDWKNYFSIYLGEASNMTFKDEKPDDKTGGWTDQGANDMRHFPVGNLLFKGIPFKIIDPHATIHTKLQKSCIILRDGTYKTWLPKEKLGIKIGKKASELSFLQCSAWSSIKGDGKLLGKYEVIYQDGSLIDIPLLQNVNTSDWWNANDLPKAKVAWQGKNEAHHDVSIGIYLFSWKNPHPEKKIKSINFKSNEKAVIILIGLSGKF